MNQCKNINLRIIAYFFVNGVVENQKPFRTNPQLAYSVHNKVFGLKIVGKYCGYQTN